MFHNLLHNATKGRRIIIILDGLDELPKSNLLWLPRELPDNVRIVLTALTNGGYYNGLKVLSSSLYSGLFKLVIHRLASTGCKISKWQIATSLVLTDLQHDVIDKFVATVWQVNLQEAG